MDKKTVYFSPIKNRRTFDEVSMEIKKLIVGGVFKPGDKLPSESEIARQFSVGRQTVREALRFLELSGFLTVQKGGGGGSIITNTIVDTISRSFLDAVQMKNISVGELTAARLCIEKLVVSYAVDNATEADLAALNENIGKGSTKIRDGVQAFEENIDFHILLARTSKNGVFVIVVESIMALVADFLSRIPQSLEISKKVLNDHKHILAAISERDRLRAEKLIEKHLTSVDGRFRSSFEQIEQEKHELSRSLSNRRTGKS